MEAFEYEFLVRHLGVSCLYIPLERTLRKNRFPAPLFLALVPQTPGGAHPRPLGWPLAISASLRFRRIGDGGQSPLPRLRLGDFAGHRCNRADRFGRCLQRLGREKRQDGTVAPQSCDRWEDIVE